MGGSPSNVNMTPNSAASTANAVLGASAGGAVNNNNTNTTQNETTVVAATTLFVNDGNEKIQEVRPTSLDSELAVGKGDDNSIALFMAKPVQIDAFNWTSSDTKNSNIATYRVSDYLTGGSTPAVWYNKISGYNLMRGTAVFRIILNAQPFQAGRLLVHFLPNEKNFTDFGDMYVKMHNYSLVNKTQHPNVELDIQDGNATIKIPYVAPALWYSRDAGYDWGTLYIDVLSTLRSASSTSVNATVYLHFEDFELAAPIFGPEGLMDGVTDAWNLAKRERNRTKDSGVVTTFFDFVSKPLDALSSVPAIGPTANAFGSLAKSLGDFTSYFGWSRPYDTKGSQVVKQHNHYRGFNFNGTTTSDVLAMDSMNQLVPMTNFAGSDVDEMAFNYLKGIPAYIGSFTWNTSTAANTNLYTNTLKLSELGQYSSLSFNGLTGDVYSYPPFVYLGRYFRYYRGGITVTIKIVKTQYHSGRLAVTFTPTSNSAFVPTAAEQRSYVYRELIDVRESDTFSFTLPYMHPAPYLNTGFLPLDADVDEVFGYFKIDVLNPLVAASTVSSEIEALVYINAAEDFQYSALAPANKLPFVPEMNTDIPRISGPIGDAPAGKFTISPNALCTGEMFTSVKQLLNMLRPIATINVPTSVDDNYSGGYLYPYNPGLPRQKTSSSFFCMQTTFDFISDLAPGFAYSRGGIRVAIPHGAADDRSTIAWHAIVSGSGVPITGAITDSAYTLPGSGDISTFVGDPYLSMPATRNGNSNLLDVIVPAYGQTPFRLNYTNAPSGNVNVPTAYDSPDYVVNFLISKTSLAQVPNNKLYRSGADDYALGYFLGFPPVVIAIVE